MSETRKGWLKRHRYHAGISGSVVHGKRRDVPVDRANANLAPFRPVMPYFRSMSVRAPRHIPEFTPIIVGLPASRPFIAPEALEREQGHRLRLRLGANESAFGLSPKAIQAMQEAVRQANWYGDPESYDLRENLAANLGVSVENLVVGNGIDGLLGYVVRAFVGPGTAVVTSLGTYPTFNYHIAAYGGALHQVPYHHDRIDLQALLDTVKATDACLVYVANPDNPSGTWCRRDDLSQLACDLPPTCTLILDEAYHEFAADDAIPAISVDQPNVIRLRTFSKAHGMAGARIGYAIAHSEVISAFGKFRNQFEVSRISQAGALASLDDPEFTEAVVCAVDEGRSDYIALAAELGLGTIPSATNFVCLDVGGPDRARLIVAGLLKRGVFVRMPGEAPLNRCIRVTVGTKPEREEFALALRDIPSR